MIPASLPILTHRSEIGPCHFDHPSRALTLTIGHPHSPLWRRISQRVSSAVEVDLLTSFIQPSGLARYLRCSHRHTLYTRDWLSRRHVRAATVFFAPEFIADSRPTFYELMTKLGFSKD